MVTFVPPFVDQGHADWYFDTIDVVRERGGDPRRFEDLDPVLQRATPAVAASARRRCRRRPRRARARGGRHRRTSASVATSTARDLPRRAGRRVRLPTPVRRAALARLVRARPAALGRQRAARHARYGVLEVMSVRGLLLAAGAGRGWGGRSPCSATLSGCPTSTAQSARCSTAVAAGSPSCSAPPATKRPRCSMRPAGATTRPWTRWSRRTGARAWGPRSGPGCGACGPHDDAVLVTLVDLPDVDALVVARVAGAAPGLRRWRARRTTGRPATRCSSAETIGPAVATAGGRPGARTYFLAHAHVSCECGDLATGRDLDRPEDLLEAGAARAPRGADWLRAWGMLEACTHIRHPDSTGRVARRAGQAARRHGLPL